MKKLCLLFLFLSLILVFPITVSANMAAPSDSDLATTITFEKNDDIIVTSEVIDIRLNGKMANINVLYHMKNTKDYDVTTKSMFISPSIEGSDTTVTANGKELSYEAKDYYATYDDIGINDWQYVILSNDNPYNTWINVQTITFNISFKSLEEFDVVVNYNYKLGGRPERNDDLKYGTIDYYLTPASMWKSFNDLTINLYLDSDMPVLEYSNLDFTKVSKRHYQYKSNELPQENLKIEIDQNGWQEFWAGFKNPYNYIYLIFIAPIAIIVALVALVVVIIIVKHKKAKKYNN